jgi:hypothetical protein
MMIGSEETRSRFTKFGVFFAWRLLALLCGRRSWAGTCVFGVICGVVCSVEVLYVAFCVSVRSCIVGVVLRTVG